MSNNDEGNTEEELEIETKELAKDEIFKEAFLPNLIWSIFLILLLVIVIVFFGKLGVLNAYFLSFIILILMTVSMPMGINPIYGLYKLYQFNRTNKDYDGIIKSSTFKSRVFYEVVREWSLREQIRKGTLESFVVTITIILPLPITIIVRFSPALSLISQIVEPLPFFDRLATSPGFLSFVVLMLIHFLMFIVFLIIAPVVLKFIIKKVIINSRINIGGQEQALVAILQTCYKATNKEITSFLSKNFIELEDIRLFDRFRRFSFLRAKLAFNLIVDICSDRENFEKVRNELTSSEFTENANHKVTAFLKYLAGKEAYEKGLAEQRRGNDPKTPFESAVASFEEAYHSWLNVKPKTMRKWAKHFQAESNYVKHLLTLDLKEQEQLLRENMKLYRQIDRSIWKKDHFSKYWWIVSKSLLLSVQPGLFLEEAVHASYSVPETMRELPPIQVIDRVNRVKNQVEAVERLLQLKKTMVEVEDEIDLQLKKIKKEEEKPKRSIILDTLSMFVIAVFFFVIIEHLFGSFLKTLERWIVLGIILPVILVLLAIIQLLRRKESKFFKHFRKNG